MSSLQTSGQPLGAGFFVSKPENERMDAKFGFNEPSFNDESNYQEFAYTPEQNQLIEDLLKTLPETLTIETRVFVKAILELERQEEIKGYSMLTLIRHMAFQLEALKDLFYTPDSLCVKSRLYHLFLSTDAWSRLFTKDFIEQWQLEAEKMMFQDNTNN